MDVDQIRALGPRLTEYVGEFGDCFARRDTREHLAVYVSGQLSGLAQKSVEPMALAAGIPPRTLQEFLARYKWDEDALRRRLHHIIARDHGSPHSIGIIDETSDAKKGVKTPGVQRQYCGAMGKQDNCIVTVHLGYAADDFHTLIDGELFLPQSWSDDRARCREAGIPDTMVYRPKTAIALELYDRAVSHGVRFEWLTFDEWYGAKPEFLRSLDARGQKFVGEVHKDFVAWTTPPRVTERPYRRRRRGCSRRVPRVLAGSAKPMTVGDMLARHAPLAAGEWVRYRIKDGEKGPLVWEAKSIPIYPRNADGLPERTYHLVVARNAQAPHELKYFVSNAPRDAPLGALLRVAFSRWRVERCFEDEKGELGLDHYEGRKYQGLKRHLILTAVSHLFLAKVHQDLRGEKPGVDRVPGPHVDVGAGQKPVALGPLRRAAARADGPGVAVHSKASRAGTGEPHESNTKATPRRRHPPRGPRAMPWARDPAL